MVARLFYIYYYMMQQNDSLDYAINNTISVMKQSRDLSDTKVFASYTVLLDTIIESPRKVMELKNPFRLSIVLSALISSGFTYQYPRYYNYDTGKVACAVAFYCFMKQTEHSDLPAYNLPTVIVLLHDGKNYMADIVEEALLDGMSPYNPFHNLEFDSMSEKKYAVVKGLEYIMHQTYNDAGFSDNSMNSWKMDIESELGAIRHLIGADFFKYAIKTYNYLDKKLKSSSPFDFDD